MKRKISRILGVAVTLAMLTSLMVASTPAQSAEPLKWGEELSPAAYTVCVTGALVPGTDVKDFAIALNGSTVYATLGTFKYPTPAHCFDPYDQKWYIAKSTMAGAMWSWVEVKDDDGDPIPTASIDLVSIADDSADGSIVAIVYNGNKVAMTEDGGSIWIDLGTPDGTAANTTAATLNCLDVNREVSGKRFIAVGGTDIGGDAGLWYMEMGATMPQWKDASVAGDGWDVSEFQAAEAVLAMEFSPNYPSDRTMAVITGPVTGAAPDTKVRLQLASFAGECWNKDQFGSTWESGGEDGQVIFDTTPNVTAAASISLPTSFIASDDTARIFFVGVSSDDAAVKGGVWRFEDDEQKVVEDSVNINSVAYNTDDDKLVAGEYFSNNVLRSDDPLSKEPDVYDSSSFKRPGVNSATSKIQVAWAGTTVFAGSQGPDSAFSKSTDDGKSFNDISMVDHDIDAIHDFVLNAAGSKVYILTDDKTDVMLWRGGSYFWTRVLTLEGAATANFTVRIAPDNENVVYVAELNSTTIYYSSDGGDSKWMYRYCGTNLVDLAVESTDSVYAVDNAGFVTKSTDGGFVWSDKVDTGLDHGATIVSIDEDKLIIGGTKGEVGYSTDGGDSWTKMSKVGAGNVQVCADGLDSGSNIYAATDVAGGDYVYRATLPGTSWTKMNEDRLTYPCYGIGLSDDGVLYAMTCKTGSSFIEVAGYAALPDSWTWTSANLTTTLIPGSISVTALDYTIAAVNGLLTDNDDPDDEDMNALCGSTGEVDYTPSATTGITVGFIETPHYIIVSFNSSSYVHRCLTPTAEEDDVVDAWSVINAPAREFDSPAPGMGPQALKITGNKLWAVTKNDGASSAKLYSLTDSIHIPEEGPPITQPEDGATLKVNKETGKAYDMIFQWDRPVKTTEEYELEIAYDSDFLAKIQTITVVSDDPTVVVALGPYSAPTGASTIEYMPGETYYWRVRVTQPFFSPWSAVRSFSTEALAVVEPEPEPVLEPVVATPAFAAEGVSIKPTFSWGAIAGATYEFVLAEDLGLDDPFEIIDYSATSDINAHIAREDLKYSTTYHWRVRSISDAGTSEWVRGIFTTEAVPEEAAPPIVIEEKPAPPAPEIYLEVPPTPAPVQVIPDYLLWVIVVVGAVLIIAVIVLIVRTRRVT